MTQLSLFDGQTRKSLGQQQVIRNNTEWKDLALEAILDLSNNCQSFTSEDLRNIIDPPSNPNAYGAIMTAACKMGYIRKTGLYIKSLRPSSHSRMLAVWCKAL